MTLCNFVHWRHTNRIASRASQVRGLEAVRHLALQAHGEPDGDAAQLRGRAPQHGDAAGLQERSGGQRSVGWTQLRLLSVDPEQSMRSRPQSLLKDVQVSAQLCLQVWTRPPIEVSFTIRMPASGLRVRFLKVRA